MKNVIEIKNLNYFYEDLLAVKDISFSVKKGEMFGLVGPDGAGKTTTMRVMCGLLNATDSEVKLFEEDIRKNKKEIQNRIGYLSQKFSLYGDLSIDENIEFFADIHNVKNFENRRDELLEFTRLKPFRKRLADKLSGGMKQKLALACALIHKPEILFLDEPTTGVDPVSRRDFWKILSVLVKDGLTVFMTTPYLDEAERCNRIALMNEGEFIALDSPENIKQSINRSVLEIICSPIRKADEILKSKLNLNTQVFGDRLNIVIQNYDKELEEIKNTLQEHNIEVYDYRETTLSLENVFIHLINNQEKK